MKSIRTVFLGTPDFAATILSKLFSSPRIEVAGVFTQPDRPGRRGKAPLAPPVKELARSYEVPVLQPSTLDRDSLDALRQLEPEALAVAAYGLLLPPEALGAAPMGAINVHASLLPRYRGAAPIQWALLNGAVVTGVTTILMEPGMDTGPILRQKALAIGIDDTAGSLHDQLADLGGDLLLDTLQALQEGGLLPVDQDPDLASYAPKLDKQARRLDWDRPAWEVHNRIRALHPSPGAFFSLRSAGGKGELRVRPHPGRIGEEPDQDPEPGSIQGLDGEGNLRIACRDRMYLVPTLQPESGRPLSARDFYNGYLA